MLLAAAVVRDANCEGGSSGADAGKKKNVQELSLKRLSPPLLYSIPGSGNTWTRLLIDHVVGHHSGSVFCDNKLADGLPGYVCMHVRCVCGMHDGACTKYCFNILIILFTLNTFITQGMQM